MPHGTIEGKVITKPPQGTNHTWGLCYHTRRVTYDNLICEPQDAGFLRFEVKLLVDWCTS